MRGSLSFSNLPLGNWFGIPVRLHWSCVLLFVFVLIQVPQLLSLYLTVFFFVILHECGHGVAARQFNAQLGDITMYPFGGALQVDGLHRPGVEFFVALAGPLTNGIFALLAWLLTRFGPPVLLSYATLVFHANLVLGIFNLLPVFPMDGGRVLRALLALVLKNHLRATLIAARLGQIGCVGFGILAVVYRQWMLGVIGAFIYLAAEGEIAAAKRRAGNSLLHDEKV